MTVFAAIKKMFSKEAPPADLPGTLIPGNIIGIFPLLYKLPDLIGLDLRYVTEDKLVPTPINALEGLDGIQYRGQAFVHENYAVGIQSGIDFANKPNWYINVIFLKADVEFTRQLLDKCVQVYGSARIGLGNGRLTGEDVKMMAGREIAPIKQWQNKAYHTNPNIPNTCRLWVYMMDQGQTACLNYRVCY